MNNQALRVGFGRALLASLAISGVLGGCVAAVGGAMVGGTMMAVDRRTTGTQLDDQTIDLRASNAVTAVMGDRAHVNASSYNRVVLLTGEVPTEADRAKVEAAVAKVENVRAVVNELAVMPNSSFTQQSNDTLITGKVKAAFVDAKELQVASMKVVTERGVVYLMGRVTEAEANVAATVTRSVSGVQKVVKVFEIITPAELAELRVPPASTA
ncbi:MAG: BON domain-containing protein, partial [Burkholderiaceae bacterium]|nr:BON domain-containing protein [Burkholderiaceae bacterium]